jgi:hypothetical protein
MMAALNGTPTDYNVGSTIRTLAEADGLVVEQEGIGNTALALQALAYGAMSLFGITQTVAQPATGLVTFATSIPVSAAPQSTLAVAIPSGSLVQTRGGVQFSTVIASILPSGAVSVDIGVVASTAGSIGNVGSGAISGAPLTPLGYPLVVTNNLPTAGGIDAGNQTQALAQFNARVARLGLASPIAVANATIGLVATGTGEQVAQASVYEPWIAAGTGPGSGQAGFMLYIDNGSGTASSSLIATVTNWLNGNKTLGESGYRPVGVPYIVAAATPVYATVGVTGVLLPGLFTSGSVATAVSSGVNNYFAALGMSPDAAYQPQVAARVSDAGIGAWSSLTVNLSYTAASGTPVPIVSGATGTRIILSALGINVSVGAF